METRTLILLHGRKVGTLTVIHLYLGIKVMQWFIHLPRILTWHLWLCYYFPAAKTAVLLTGGKWRCHHMWQYHCFTETKWLYHYFSSFLFCQAKHCGAFIQKTQAIIHSNKYTIPHSFIHFCWVLYCIIILLWQCHYFAGAYREYLILLWPNSDSYQYHYFTGDNNNLVQTHKTVLYS